MKSWKLNKDVVRVDLNILYHMDLYFFKDVLFCGNDCLKGDVNHAKRRWLNHLDWVEEGFSV